MGCFQRNKLENCMVSGSIKSYHLIPSYIDRDENGEMRKFQSELIKFVNEDKERVAILDPPTGSGKTYSFKRIGNSDKKTIIVLPNNLLANEVSKDFGIESIVLNKDAIMYNIRERQKKYNLQRTSVSETIIEMISNKTQIITNPTVFYYLLLNHYNEGQKEDMISRLVKNNVKVIIFDEFHIYSKDQISMITACAMIIPKQIKIIFSTATPPDYFIEFSKSVFGNSEVRNISVNRTYETDKQKDLLQGPIELNIVNQESIDFTSANIELFKKGKWVSILDSIRNVDRVGKILTSHFPKDSIAFISAYYDTSYIKYHEIKNEKKDYRIILSTNIIEQGININKEYQNFVIEMGQSLSNLVQRMGRVGRGIKETSKVFICLPSGFSTPNQEVRTIDDAYELFRKMNYGKNSPVPNSFGIGVYIGLLIEKLTPYAEKVILENLLGYQNKRLSAGIYSYKNVVETFSNREGLKKIKKNCFPEIIEIKEWFDDYKNTIYNFIADESQKVKLIDTDYDLQDNFLRTEYSEIWINKNKEIIGHSEDGLFVGEFNTKPNYDFEVKVLNMPDGVRIMRYADIAFQAKKEIMSEFEKILEEDLCEENEKMELLKKDLISIVRETAGLERLKLEVTDEG